MKRALAWFLSKLLRSNVEAFTVFGRTIWLIPGVEIASRYPTLREGLDAVARLARHENEHAQQQKREPLAFYPKYLWYLVTRGYRENPYEVQARAMAGDP